MKILLIEDDKPTRAAIAAVLAAHHYVVDVAEDGETGWELAETSNYDLIVLDLNIPKLDGMSICRQLRSQGNQTPILLLTARDASTDRVMGLDAGADDYVVKPFDMAELMARIRALIRRGTALSQPILTWGTLHLNPSSAEVTYENQPLKLTPKEYGLLELFLLNPSRVFSRSVILERLWSYDDSPGEETVTTHIKSLRQKLKAAGAIADPIETVYGLGYRLKGIERTQPADQSDKPDEPEKSEKSEPKVEQTKLPANSLSQAQISDSILLLWQKYKSGFMAQFETLQQANWALSRQQLTSEQQQQARQEAHKLAGSLGVFGLVEGSKLAHDLEELLQAPTAIAAQLPEMTRLVQSLKVELEREPTPQSPPTSASVALGDRTNLTHPARLLIIDRDQELSQQIQQAAAMTSLQVDVITQSTIAKAGLPALLPDIILLNLVFPDRRNKGLRLLTELAQHYPTIPVLVLAEGDKLSDRVEVARLGGQAFLQKPLPPDEILNAVMQTLQQVQLTEARILVVDDDPAILAAITALLTPWGLEVKTLNQPQQFWDILSASRPDLLILDLEMPTFSGIDLCQVVRNDTRWGNLPILFLTAHTTPDRIHQMFAAGADDYIGKPIVEPELITRIISRVDRARLSRQQWKRNQGFQRH